MKTTIEVVVSPTGNLSIDAVGFNGADCEKATRFVEEALDTVKGRVKKPEYHQIRNSQLQQRIGV